MTFSDLGTALQIRLKRAFVRVEVVRKGTDAQFKYYMFKRLNTGGQLLTEQQIRNCTIRLLDPTFNDFIIALSGESAFKECVNTLTYERRLTAFDQELVLRFFAFKNNLHEFRHDVADYLTEYMESVAKKTVPFDYASERACFTKTFTILQLALGDLAFAFAVPGKSALSKGFSVYHYEAFTLGIQNALPNFNESDDDQIARLAVILNDIKRDSGFIAITRGGGKNSPGPLRDRINFVRERVQNV